VPEPPTRGLNHDLMDAIISQQLSVQSAAAIATRFLALFPDNNPSPPRLLETSEETLRGVGLSRPKIAYLSGIARAVVDGSLDLDTLATLDDEAFIRELTALKGVGRWTGEMMLIFSLRRPDVFSVGDLGLREAVSRLYNLDREDRPAIAAHAERWKPYRSLASLYLWQSLRVERNLLSWTDEPNEA
jgi:DNA-3-methyladenine glycosylase II